MIRFLVFAFLLLSLSPVSAQSGSRLVERYRGANGTENFVEDIIQDEISRCWNIPIGAQEINELIGIDVDINRQGKITHLKIIDQDAYNYDPYFTVAADALVRATKNRECLPLKFPDVPYKYWRHLRLWFNPKEQN